MKVYHHPSPSPILHHALVTHLPDSINLVYRTQHKNRSPNARILATFAPSLPPPQLSSEPVYKASLDNIPQCWAAAYLDRSMRPETDLWIFAPGQMANHIPSLSPQLRCDPKGSPTSGEAREEFCPTCAQAIYTLLDHISTLPIPPLNPANGPLLAAAQEHAREHPKTGPDAKYDLSAGSYLRHLLEPTIVTLGGCHEKIVQLCEEAGLIRTEFPGLEAPLDKFFFRVADLPPTTKLPEGLRWGKVREGGVEVVRARTAIPRAPETLVSLESVGVFEDGTGKMVAWAFLGLDGSLTTLHTEPEYRGRGIAKAVASRVFEEHAAKLAVDGEGNAWAHGDVYLDNEQSARVCRSLGGKPGMRVFWVRIDMAKAGTLAVL